MSASSLDSPDRRPRPSLIMNASENRFRHYLGKVGVGFLFAVTCSALLTVGFIFYYMFRDAIPFFLESDIGEFFFSSEWYPTHEPAEFGAASMFVGSFLVTAAAIIFAVPIGVVVAVCLSDVMPFWLRQYVKPVVEMLASIPSVAFGFFALVVVADKLQTDGGFYLKSGSWLLGLPCSVLLAVVLGDIFSERLNIAKTNLAGRIAFMVAIGAPMFLGLYFLGETLGAVKINSGANALNVSIILGIMALPTIVSVSEDALQAVGPELRMGSYALGATRSETMIKAIIPAASSGIIAAIILGVMRAIGETMVVWMASGNSAHIPDPIYDLTEPIRTLTATIAGEMGEADQSTGSQRYHVLFAMAVSLLMFCFLCNTLSEWIVARNRKKLRGE